MQKNAFGVLVTIDEGVPFANHIPLIIDAGVTLRIYGHMAKSNQQWTHFRRGTDVLVIYQGPHAYVSPSSYVEQGIPTWNYAVVHMYGKAKPITDKTSVSNIVETMSHQYEKNQKSPWLPNYHPAALDAIVAFEILVDRVEAKSKLSQNRPRTDRIKIAADLRQSGSEGGLGVALLMEENES